jgi:DNA-binding NarL/FixJ family response regulator
MAVLRQLNTVKSALCVVNIVAIEDHAIILSIVERVGEDVFPGARIALARDGQAGLELCRREQPGLVLLDVELPDCDGFDLVAQIRSCSPEARILVLSSHTEPYVIHRLNVARIDGFVDKNDQPSESLAAALRAVSSGARYFSPAVERALSRHRSDPQSFDKILSSREQELLRMLGQSLSDLEISEKAGLSELTVRNHRRNIMAKLDLHSTPELIRYALENGFSRAHLIRLPS